MTPDYASGGTRSMNRAGFLLCVGYDWEYGSG